MEILNTNINEINRLHNLAQASASDAIEYAKQAGALLIDAKKRLKHGQFLSWINDNLSVSARQVQRYMAVAHGKTIPLRKLIEKSDTVSQLTEVVNTGAWKNEHWNPERGYIYVFNEDEADYWVTPCNSAPMGFHICKHYAGKRTSSEGFYLRYTVLAEENYKDMPTQYYIGTKHPIHLPSGVQEILGTFGLKDLKTTLVYSCLSTEGYERPHAEPSVECWYWDEGSPEYDLFIKYVRKSNI